ncbi:type 1 glutamine amidotransferase domain-containing protein [Glaciecola sp. 1036]|uniref:type 1 glutamine amidotransferase domain-containing protein n=1 Tax=Alteromonadaceae TaxID=72275 RepID=UPI003D0440BB
MRVLLIVVIFALGVAFEASGETNKGVLIIASNMLDMGDPEKHEARNDLFEFAPPYHVFVSHGYEVDFVSPLGGKVEFMREPLGISSYTIKYEGFLDKTANTLTPEEVDPSKYSGVFTGGGYGVMFDVAKDAKIQAIIGQIYQNQGIVGAGGHGTASIINVKLPNGEYLVKDKRIAGFPNSTETSKPWAKQGTLLPFLIESQLKKNGAIAENKETLSDKHQVVIDNRIVSTMFLPSAALVAKEMILLMEQNK